MYTAKKVKHNKLRNTGLIFELLTRQITSDILNNKESDAINIVKEFFSKSGTLINELKLYKTLVEVRTSSEWKANEIIRTVVDTRKKLNETTLENQKYNLIKRIKKSYDINEFFNHKTNTYKVHASIYKLFEFADTDSPMEMVNSKECIIEHLNSNNTKLPNAQTLLEEEFGKEDKDIRILAYKILLEKFNDKYKDLDSHQKHLLRLYITNSPNTQHKLLEYVTTSAKLIQTNLKQYSSKIDSQVIKIKLNEVGNLLESIKTTKHVKDSDILSVLRYFELIKEIKKVNENITD